MVFGKKVKTLRKSRDMTLKELSILSNVSSSMLSQIEREEKNPTIQVACQIAEALNTTLSYLLDEQEDKDIILLKKAQRPIYVDEKSGFQRHLLSPSLSSQGIEFILNIIPPFSESGVFPAHKVGVKENIYISKGRLDVELGGGSFSVELVEGDSFYFAADTEHRFINLSNEECHYFLVIDSTHYRGGSSTLPKDNK
ncbi:helix-turn-helix domain-containing protein [Chengkuizengella axinellae]|uniref:XRE family transcriptional regulator n=1 Tax=Chengkuizengella axinellae TaxID=3064388 RepID=A0ABT9J3P5_9BACL|nr:XRE family transcriptional regulator [Chengkuizengella sp. 2205SS18-9]MDP5276252.1 XRE family transcriptional regulator [Chengkuizengella sp. 2205SS18-9]